MPRSSARYRWKCFCMCSISLVVDPAGESLAGAADGSAGVEPVEVGQADIDERADPLLHPVLARKLERLLVGGAHLVSGDPLFQPVVACDQKLLNLFPDLIQSTKTSRGIVFFGQF